MNFEFRNGLIWLPVEIQYDGLMVRIDNCILDTGSATTAIDIDYIQFNYCKPAKIRRLFGVGDGTQEVVCQRIDFIRLGDDSIQNAEIEFGYFKSRIGISGFIGNDILSNFGVSIDFKNRNISFAHSE
jgi:hypothetical protein